MTKGALGIAGIFVVDDIHKTYEELKAKGVEFTEEPTSASAARRGLRDPFGNALRIDTRRKARRDPRSRRAHRRLHLIAGLAGPSVQARESRLTLRFRSMFHGRRYETLEGYNMLAKIHDRLSYANVMATFAVFMAMGGGAYALSIPKNSVGAKQLKKNAVRGSKIKRGAVSSSDVNCVPTQSGLQARPASDWPPRTAGAEGGPGPHLLRERKRPAAGAVHDDPRRQQGGSVRLRQSAGVYLVTFNRDVSMRGHRHRWGHGPGLQANIRDPVVSVGGGFSGEVPKSTIRVEMFIPNSNQTDDTSFHLIVAC